MIDTCIPDICILINEACTIPAVVAYYSIDSGHHSHRGEERVNGIYTHRRCFSSASSATRVHSSVYNILGFLPP